MYTLTHERNLILIVILQKNYEQLVSLYLNKGDLNCNLLTRVQIAKQSVTRGKTTLSISDCTQLLQNNCAVRLKYLNARTTSQNDHLNCNVYYKFPNLDSYL